MQDKQYENTKEILNLRFAAKGRGEENELPLPAEGSWKQCWTKERCLN